MNHRFISYLILLLLASCGKTAISPSALSAEDEKFIGDWYGRSIGWDDSRERLSVNPDGHAFYYKEDNGVIFNNTAEFEGVFRTNGNDLFIGEKKFSLEQAPREINFWNEGDSMRNIAFDGSFFQGGNVWLNDPSDIELFEGEWEAESQEGYIHVSAKAQGLNFASFSLHQSANAEVLQKVVFRRTSEFRAIMGNDSIDVCCAEYRKIGKEFFFYYGETQFIMKRVDDNKCLIRMRNLWRNPDSIAKAQLIDEELIFSRR